MGVVIPFRRRRKGPDLTIGVGEIALNGDGRVFLPLLLTQVGLFRTTKEARKALEEAWSK